MTGGLPSFVIIGAVRAGSTGLHRYLDDHPQVAMAPKELHFFDKRYGLGVEWYRQQMADCAGAVAVGESTPRYMYDREAMARMADVLPDARLVAILRDPVDRAYSHYWMMRARGKERRDFGAALRAEEDTGPVAVPGYLSGGRYAAHLEEVSRLYARERLHVLLFEDLRRDPVATYSQVCRFLGVDDDEAPPSLGDQANAYVTFRSQTVRRMTRAYRSRRVRRLPGPVRRVRRVVARLNTRTGVAYPPLAPDERASAAAYFDAHNAALAEWLGRDLSVWQHA
jgi:hypothetical protein